VISHARQGSHLEYRSRTPLCLLQHYDVELSLKRGKDPRNVVLYTGGLWREIRRLRIQDFDRSVVLLLEEQQPSRSAALYPRSKRHRNQMDRVGNRYSTLFVDRRIWSRKERGYPIKVSQLLVS
jgi:hypothetical protein